MNTEYVKYSFTNKDNLYREFGLDKLFEETAKMAKEDLDDLNERFKNNEIKVESRWLFIKSMVIGIYRSFKTINELISNFYNGSRIYIKIGAYKEIPKSFIDTFNNNILDFVKDIIFNFGCMISGFVLPMKYINTISYYHDKRVLESIIDFNTNIK